MSLRLVLKAVTLNDLERHNGRYIALFQRIWQTCVPTPNCLLEHWTFWSKLACITQRTVKLLCVTKFTHSLVNTKLIVYHISCYFLLIYCLSFTFLSVLMFGFRCSVLAQ